MTRLDSTSEPTIPRFRGWGRVKAMGRVAAYLTCLNFVVGVACAQYARAEVERSVSRGGLELLQKLGPELVGEGQEVRLNGQRMFLSTKVTRAPLEQVLDSVERYCQNPEAPLATFGSAPAQHAPSTASGESGWDYSRLLISRLEDPEGASGQVACFANGEHDKTFDGFVRRLGKFGKTLNLGALGDMRYAVAQRDEKKGLTHLLVLWTDGSLNVPALFPAHGDAPGTDSLAMPRPPAAVRILSAEIGEHPYALRQYDSTKTAAEVLAHYDNVMQERGWTPSPLAERPGVPSLAPHLHAFVKGGAATLVFANAKPADKTRVSLVELGTTGHVRVTPGFVE